MEKEVWKIMKEHSNYEVSSLGRIKNKKRPSYIKIIQKDKNRNVIKIWKNIDEIVCNNNYHRSNIYKCCQGKLKTAYGYIWNYL